jgi:uncharacterized protein (UPF0333 family)
MKILIQKIKKILHSNKGETLIESIASLLVLTVLIAAISTMINFSLRITSDATRNARAMQDTVNEVIWEEPGDSLEITFTFIDSGGIAISASHDVEFNEHGGIRAFYPQP